MSIQNGQVWEAADFRRAVTQWISGDQWLLLGTPGKAAHGGTCMVAHTSRRSDCVWHGADQLEAYLTRTEWKLTDITVVENL